MTFTWPHVTGHASIKFSSLGCNNPMACLGTQTMQMSVEICRSSISTYNDMKRGNEKESIVNQPPDQPISVNNNNVIVFLSHHALTFSHPLFHEPYSGKANHLSIGVSQALISVRGWQGLLIHFPHPPTRKTQASHSIPGHPSLLTKG